MLCVIHKTSIIYGHGCTDGWMDESMEGDGWSGMGWDGRAGREGQHGVDGLMDRQMYRWTSIISALQLILDVM